MAIRNSTQSVSSGTTISVNTPTYVAGDIIVLAFYTGGNGSALTTVSTPSGFTQYSLPSAVSCGTLACFWKVAASEPGSYSTTFGASNVNAAVAVSLSGRNSTQTLTAQTAYAASLGAGAISVPVGGLTAAAGDDLIGFYAMGTNSPTPTPSLTTAPSLPSTFTIYQQANSGTYNDLSFCALSGVSAGSIANFNATMTNGAAGAAAYIASVVNFAQVAGPTYYPQSRRRRSNVTVFFPR